METVEAAASLVSNRDDLLRRLWTSLVRWVRRRVRCSATAADVAAETVSRAWRRFFFDSLSGAAQVSWNDLWAWSVRVARNLLIDAARRARTARIIDGADVGQVVAPAAAASSRSPRASEQLLAALRARLAAADLATLQLLLAGVDSNVAIAELRGVTLRSIERSRRRLRSTGATVWQECRASRCRTAPSW